MKLSLSCRKPVLFLATLALLLVAPPKQDAAAADYRDMKARLLANIAFEYAEIEDAAKASAVSERALQAIAAMENPCYQANDIARVGGSYWLIGDKVKGEKLVAEAIETAIAQDKTGCSSSATSPTESLLNRAQEYAEDGHFDFAVALSRNGAPYGLTELALVLFEAGQTQQANRLINEALATIRKMDSSDPMSRFALQLLNFMAVRLEGTGHRELSLQVLEEAATLANTPFSRDSQEASMQISGQLRTVRGFIKVGEKDRAIALLDRITPALLELPPDTSALIKLDSVVDVAVLYQQIGLKERAADLFARAEQRVRDLPTNEKGMGLGRVARGYAEAGNFDRAMELAQSVPPGERAGLLESLAFARLERGDLEGTLQMARASANPQMVRPIIRHYLARKQPDKAFALQQEYKITDLRSEIAVGFLEAGQPDKALAMVRSESLEGFMPDVVQSFAGNGQSERALQLARDEELKWLLPSVARGFARQGEFDRAVEIARSIETPVERATALIAVASAWSERDTGDGEQGAFQHWLNSIFGKARDSERDRVAALLEQALDITQSLK